MSEPSDTGAGEVGAILEQLRAEVRARRLARGVAEQGGYERDVRRALDELELHRVVSAHWPLTARSPAQRAMNLVHKVVRRFLRWYINPIVEQQNAANDALARSLRLLADAYLDLAEQVAEVRAHIDEGATTIAPQDDIVHRPDDAQQRPDDTQRQPDDTQQRPDDTQQRPVASQAAVRARAAYEPPAHFMDLELRTSVAALRERSPVNAHWPLVGATLAEKAVALHNRLVRQYLRWYINPIVEQQNAANDALAAAIASMARLDEQRRAQVATLRAATATRRNRRSATHTNPATSTTKWKSPWGSTLD